jgi:hypothetical protein
MKVRTIGVESVIMLGKRKTKHENTTNNNKT